MGNVLLGLFLMAMGVAMAAMTITYRKTENMQTAWAVFGALYTVGIFATLGNSALKNWLQIETGKSFFSLWSIVILAVGISLALFVGAKKDERTAILGVLLAVGVHFLPFGAWPAYLLAGLCTASAVVGLLNSKISIYKLLTADAMIKFAVGAALVILR